VKDFPSELQHVIGHQAALAQAVAGCEA
jgi:hypothetical protein